MLLMLMLTTCVSLTGTGTGSAPAEERDSPNNLQRPARDYLIDTPEHTVMDSPWFTVSSVILQLKRTQPETTIIVPSDSKIRRYLGLDPSARRPTTTIPGNRFLFSLGIMTDGVPPFTSDPDRYRYPDLYE